MSSARFPGSALVMLVAIAAALFVLSLLLGSRETSALSSGDRAGAGTFSTSAIGYAGLYAALEKLGWRVGRITDGVSVRPDERVVVILAEPDLNLAASIEALAASRRHATILVLPKWRGKPDPSRSAWIGEVEPAAVDAAAKTLELAYRKGRVVRQPWPARWAVNRLGKTPGGIGRAQLVRSGAVQPIVGTADEILVGKTYGKSGELFILSDPDVMANHGVMKGENAEFVLALLELAAGGEAAVRNTRFLFDESVHGYRGARFSPLRLIFGFPYAAFTALAFAAAGVALLAGISRFGPAARPKRGIEFGKRRLIDNSARLMRHAGHQTTVLRQYIDMEMHSAAAGLHAPQGLARLELARWLDRIGRARNVAFSCERLLSGADRRPTGNVEAETHLLRLARDMHRWKGEMLDGSGRNRADGGGHQG